jgi:hypothetical protein
MPVQMLTQFFEIGDWFRKGRWVKRFGEIVQKICFPVMRKVHWTALRDRKAEGVTEAAWIGHKD